MRTLSLHLSAIYTPYDHCSYRTLTSFAVLSSYVASYMISVRQTRGLPRASFRFNLTVDTLAFGYVLTATGRTRVLHPLEFANAGRNRVGGALPRCPLTPPHIRIRIRRFNSLSVLTRKGCLDFYNQLFREFHL